ncbi:MAG: bifunctional adenosylcobinamide kinase/adenosylcobinamide-phosphate guanylyltransferase [Hansschlegelia sp.]
MAPARPRGRDVSLIIGGARSGKSRFAEGLATATGLPVAYVATARGDDAEMRERIARHRAERPASWTTIDAPLALARAIEGEATPARVVLVDCLTLWLTNVMLGDLDVEHEIAGLLAALGSAAGPVVLVSNEVGYGIVPDNALARAFRDHQGRLNQRVAGLASRVTLVAAGLPLDLKLPKKAA